MAVASRLGEKHCRLVAIPGGHLPGGVGEGLAQPACQGVLRGADNGKP